MEFTVPPLLYFQGSSSNLTSKHRQVLNQKAITLHVWNSNTEKPPNLQSLMMKQAQNVNLNISENFQCSFIDCIKQLIIKNQFCFIQSSYFHFKHSWSSIWKKKIGQVIQGRCKVPASKLRPVVGLVLLMYNIKPKYKYIISQNLEN